MAGRRIFRNSRDRRQMRRAAFLLVAVELTARLSAGQQRTHSSMEFEYISVMGPSDVDVHLTIHDGKATLVRRPEAPRKDGALIGVFRATADPAFLHWLEQGVPERLPEGAGSLRPDMPVVRV